MPRSTDILSRVIKNLQKEGVNIDLILDQEIFEEMTLAQDRIISDAFPDKVITIALADGIKNYPLTTDTSDPIIRANIASVKIAKLPNGWTTTEGVRDYGNWTGFPNGFNIIPNDLFVSAVNANQEMTGRPKIGTVIGGQLEVYPIPDAEVDGEEIELYVYLSSSSGVINATSEPELPNYYDKAFEIYATAQFLPLDKRAMMLVEFDKEVRRVRSILNRKHHNLSRKPIEGLL